jgi:hypothetical protein
MRGGATVTFGVGGVGGLGRLQEVAATTAARRTRPSGRGSFIGEAGWGFMGNANEEGGWRGRVNEEEAM